MKRFLSLCALAVLIGAASGLAGCATGPGEHFATKGARNAELVWLGLDAIDTGQTVTIARSPQCLYEANPMAAAIYGSKNPSESRVVATNAALALVHYELAGFIDRRTEAAFSSDSPNRGAWYVGRIAYYGLSFLGSGIAVGGNYQLGVKPFSRKTC